MNTKRFSNKYGSFELEIIGEFTNVSNIKSNEISLDCFFDIDVAEKIALISENKSIQISTSKNMKHFYCVFHHSSSIVAVGKVKSLIFNNQYNASRELEEDSYKLVVNQI
jgi:hypothetical protein